MSDKDYCLYTYIITAKNDEKGNAYISDWEETLKKAGCKYTKLKGTKVVGVKWVTAIEIE